MIDRVVGILTITNVHFQELFDQFLRHLQQATLSRIQIDTRVATISMHTVSFWHLANIPSRPWQMIYPSLTLSHDPIAVPYSAKVLISHSKAALELPDAQRLLRCQPIHTSYTRLWRCSRGVRVARVHWGPLQYWSCWLFCVAVLILLVHREQMWMLLPSSVFGKMAGNNESMNIEKGWAFQYHYLTLRWERDRTFSAAKYIINDMLQILAETVRTA